MQNPRTNFTDRSETMSLKRFSRAGLIALAGAMLLGIALSVPTFHSSYAQAPAATNPPAATAPAPDAAAPAALASRCRAASLRRRQGDGKLHAEFGRHRLDADLDGHRADDDHSGAGAVLRRHGPQEERRRHHHDEFCHHLPDQHSVAVLHLQHGVPRRHAVHRRARSRVSAEHDQQHLQQRGRGAEHRHAQFAGADNS